MGLSALSISTHLSNKRVRLRRGAEISGWLFLFVVAGATYLWAAFSKSWSSVPIFAGTLFLVVGLGTLWDRTIVGRPLLNSRTVVLAGVLFWLLLDPLLMRKGLDDFTPEVLVTALLYAAGFIVAVWLGYLIKPLAIVKRFFSSTPAQTNDDLLFVVTVAIYVISIVPLITAANSVSELWRLLLAGYSPDVDVAWRRGMLGSQQDFFKSIARLLQLSIPFLGTYLISRKLVVWKKLLLGSMILSLLMITFFGGERRLFAFVVLGPLSYVFFTTSTKVLKRRLPIFAVLVLLLFWGMQAQLQFRSGGFYNFDATAVESNPFEMHRDNNFYWFATAVDTMPNTYEYTNEWIFLQIFTHPIPRFLWPQKPFATGFPFVQWEDTGASLSISLVGELYISQGIFGIILGGLVYGWLARNWDTLRPHLDKGSASGLIYSLGLTLLLIGVRSFGDIVLNWYVLALVILLVRNLGIKRSRAGVRAISYGAATS
jgi:oligosaccharide repeat unit polymerase